MREHDKFGIDSGTADEWRRSARISFRNKPDEGRGVVTPDKDGGEEKSRISFFFPSLIPSWIVARCITSTDSNRETSRGIHNSSGTLAFVSSLDENGTTATTIAATTATSSSRGRGCRVVLLLLIDRPSRTGKVQLQKEKKKKVIENMISQLKQREPFFLRKEENANEK